ncbi:CCR4-NOT transcription complex, subunit 3 [Puttea exsequens]|nr:CCR4-NOT transcription complex, subunit 3 [Puttea exsequens]
MSDPYNQPQPSYGSYAGQPQQGQTQTQHPDYYQQQGYNQQQVAPYSNEQQQYQQPQYGQQEQYPQQQQQQLHDPNSQPPNESDRGLGGALTGGLAGGFGGHQAGHGILGAIGGAIIGSFAEDKLKKRKEEKLMEHQQRPGSGQGHHGQGGHGGGVHGGFTETFSETASFGGFGGKKH